MMNFFSYLTQVTHFYYQKIQIEVPYNSLPSLTTKKLIWQDSSYWEITWLQLPPATGLVQCQLMVKNQIKTRFLLQFMCEKVGIETQTFWGW